MDKKGKDLIKDLLIVLLIFIIGFSLFDVFNEKLSKKEISGEFVKQDISLGSDKGLELKQLTDQLNSLNNNFRIKRAF